MGEERERERHCACKISIKSEAECGSKIRVDCGRCIMMPRLRSTVLCNTRMTGQVLTCVLIRDCTGRAGLWAPGPISVVRTRASRIPGSLSYGLLRLFGLFWLFGLGA